MRTFYKNIRKTENSTYNVKQLFFYLISNIQNSPVSCTYMSRVRKLYVIQKFLLKFNYTIRSESICLGKTLHRISIVASIDVVYSEKVSLK